MTCKEYICRLGHNLPLNIQVEGGDRDTQLQNGGVVGQLPPAVLKTIRATVEGLTANGH